MMHAAQCHRSSKLGGTGNERSAFGRDHRHKRIDVLLRIAEEHTRVFLVEQWIVDTGIT